MLTVDESLQFARQMYTPQSFAGVLCAEVERLSAELAARPMPECACGDGIMPSNAGCCASCMYEMELTIKGLREELATREWRTIESAPRDCRVLLWCEKPVFNGMHAVTGRWNADKFAGKPRPYWTNDLEQIRGVLYTRATQPTHWMPLPLPLPPEPKP